MLLSFFSSSNSRFQFQGMDAVCKFVSGIKWETSGKELGSAIEAVRKRERA